MISGEMVNLCALEPADLPLLKMWRNQEHYRKYFREWRELTMANQQQWYEKLVVNDDRTQMFGIEEKATGKLIGVCGLCYINFIHRYADFSLYIGKDDIYIDTAPNGFAVETMHLLLELAFDRMNLNKVWCEIYAFDDKKHTLFEQNGWTQDGVLRQNYFYDGAYQDSHIYSILASDWRQK